MSPLREHLRDTFWFAPVIGLVGAVVLALVCALVDDVYVAELQREREYGELRDMIHFADTAKSIVAMIGSSVLTLVGVVFSISLVALQMVSSQWSQRVLRLYVRSRVTKGTFAAFLATFVFSLLVQLQYPESSDPQRVQSVPFVTIAVAFLLVILSLGLFIGYVNATMSLMRVSHVVDRISRDARRLLVLPARPYVIERVGERTATVVHRGRAGVLRDVHVARLVRVASAQGVVVHLLPRIGDFLVPGTPVIAVYGEWRRPGKRRWAEWAFDTALSTGVERTFHQDLGFGLRQLVDIALRALSPAVNDPTTAVQCLDRVQQFLAEAADKPLGLLLHTDRAGAPRLVQDLPRWEDLVKLGFTEIRSVATRQPQVTRRLRAALEDLVELAPEERRAPLLRQRELLEHAMERDVPDVDEREFALTADRQGIG
ncbi:DUF2254 domain-containing protein [Streptomyces sp. NPDC048172]|uniref:DUF2254 domain-containing protein n=1 Tax=Streptomyces sp. NPDC048172 TaxID=3365505 RepID=UPI00371C17CF